MTGITSCIWSCQVLNNGLDFVVLKLDGLANHRYIASFFSNDRPSASQRSLRLFAELSVANFFHRHRVHPTIFIWTSPFLNYRFIKNIVLKSPKHVNFYVVQKQHLIAKTSEGTLLSSSLKKSIFFLVSTYLIFLSIVQIFMQYLS